MVDNLAENAKIIKADTQKNIIERKNNLPNSLQVGIVGTGLMGRFHSRAARRAGGKIVAIADINSQNAEILLKKFPSAKLFRDVGEMLNFQKLDVLHVCTPLETHQRITDLAIKSKVNVMVEKPMTLTGEECVNLYDLASTNNIKICPAHQMPFQPGIGKAKKFLPYIGQIIHLESSICSAGGASFNQDQFDYIANDILPHPLSLFQTILNQLLTENNWKVFRPSVGELRVFNNQQKISTSIFVSLNSRPTQNLLRIFGTNGTIYVDLFHGFAFMEAGKVSKMRKIIHPFSFSVKQLAAASTNLLTRIIRFETAYPGLNQLVKKFYQSITEGSQLPISSNQCINVARIRDFIFSQLPDAEERI